MSMRHKHPKEHHETMNVSEVKGDVDYEAVIKEFGLERMQPFLEKMKAAKMKLPVMYRRNLVIAQRDFSIIYNAMISKNKFAVLTGINPSGALHLGNRMFVDQAMFFQEYGGHVFIPISNDETYVFKKAETLEKATENVIEVISDMIALGLDPRRTHFLAIVASASDQQPPHTMPDKNDFLNFVRIIFTGLVQ